MTQKKEPTIRGHYKKHKPLVCPHCHELVRGNKEKGIKPHKRCKNCTILLHEGQICDCTEPKDYYHPATFY